MNKSTYVNQQWNRVVITYKFEKTQELRLTFSQLSQSKSKRGKAERREEAGLWHIPGKAVGKGMNKGKQDNTSKLG